MTFKSNPPKIGWVTYNKIENPTSLSDNITIFNSYINSRCVNSLTIVTSTIDKNIYTMKHIINYHFLGMNIMCICVMATGLTRL